ncbi:GTP-binding protein rho4-like [Octopus sinensis]|uniref:GTP-binding protein rho4-like n=1 Tax=Octopus sinensis TaxID=2607531 RepID=A0A7E6EII3_9MOLL|nr:GTP-binding protein rho4-like [Octopus sinensis]
MPKRLKIVTVGDGGCGKTCMLQTFANGAYPTEYVPTVFETYITEMLVEIALWDTAGQEDYDRLRPLSYPDTDVALLCFDIADEGSFANITEKWMPEVLLSQYLRFVYSSKKKYIECSAMEQYNLQHIFESAVRISKKSSGRSKLKCSLL